MLCKSEFQSRLVLVLAGAYGSRGVRACWVKGVLPPGGTAQLVAGTTDIKLPAFDVVSVKQDKSVSGMIRVMTKPDGYSATNVSLKMLIQSSLWNQRGPDFRTPGWADSARYDIDAKVAGSDVDTLKKLSPEQRRSMLQPMLGRALQAGGPHRDQAASSL